MGILGGKFSKDDAGVVRKRHRIWSQESWDPRFDSAITKTWHRSFDLSGCPSLHLEFKGFD